MAIIRVDPFHVGHCYLEFYSPELGGVCCKFNVWYHLLVDRCCAVWHIMRYRTMLHRDQSPSLKKEMVKWLKWQRCVTDTDLVISFNNGVAKEMCVEYEYKAPLSDFTYFIWYTQIYDYILSALNAVNAVYICRTTTLMISLLFDIFVLQNQVLWVH